MLDIHFLGLLGGLGAVLVCWLRHSGRLVPERIAARSSVTARVHAAIDPPHFGAAASVVQAAWELLLWEFRLLLQDRFPPWDRYRKSVGSRLHRDGPSRSSCGRSRN